MCFFPTIKLQRARAAQYRASPLIHIRSVPLEIPYGGVWSLRHTCPLIPKKMGVFLASPNKNFPKNPLCYLTFEYFLPMSFNKKRFWP